MRARLTVLVLSAVAILGLTASAYANAIRNRSAAVAADCTTCVSFEETNEGGIGERNILFGNPAQGPSLTITGHIVPVPVNGQAVDFTSTLAEGDLWATGGQSDVDACTNTAIACPNGLITSVTITEPGHEFTDLILDPQKLSADNTLSLSVVTTGGTQTFGPYGKHSNGNNFVTIEAEPGIEILSVTLSTPPGLGFEDLKQPRISGANITPVPELSSMLLLGSGLLVCTQVLRRKRKNPS